MDRHPYRVFSQLFLRKYLLGTNNLRVFEIKIEILKYTATTERNGT